MKTVYFIFKNMKEAEYYFKGLSYYLPLECNNVECTRNPFKIVMPRIKKKNIFEKIFGRKENELEIILKSEKSNLIDTADVIYHFPKDEYDADFFIEFVKGL